ncbi:uncharacterized protein LOC134258196 [Saccostrea cucullata]|uniref:uncharacterized protein LOC134258196 n=1 Tax=Saccostrea cuccullata TaxID=36930 RepID=UPI002ED247EB
MDHLPRLSEAVYVGLCLKIGSPSMVRMRREVMDTNEAVSQPVNILKGFDRMESVSKREGFRLSTSDPDFMLWSSDHKVICDLSQISFYRISQHTVILMECGDLPPGFSRLNLMSQSNNSQTISSCVVVNNKAYLSSTLFRDNHLRFVRSCNVPLTNAFPHGPCSKYSLFQEADTGLAFCIQSHHWPKLALPWIERCCERGWPEQNVLDGILNGGFHVVPIGSTSENELEWRISFSKAEHKVLYSMNHCQFLCYGLLKKFLKEVVNGRTNTTILCSYFIKTIVFWVI